MLPGRFKRTANAILTDLAVGAVPTAPTLGSALAVAAFTAGTAARAAVAAASLQTDLGAVGPVVTGTVVAALTLVPARPHAHSQTIARRAGRPPDDSAARVARTRPAEAGR